MDLRQVARYSGPTREAVLARAAEDLATARAAGFEIVGSPRWDDRRVSPTLVVELRYAPPERLTRRRIRGEFSRDIVVRDAGQMAFAGYRAESYRWIAATGSKGPGTGQILMDYVYDPDTVGEPVAPIPPEDVDRDEVWWPVHEDLRPVSVPRDDPLRHIPTLRRAFLRLIGAPATAIDR
ncbi:MAG: hypothetical protein U0869_11455 [Chloroflexota bacterium]